MNCTALFVSSFHRRGWWVYLLVPGYLVWKFGGYLWGWFDKKYEEEGDENADPKLAKKLEKQKKKEEKPKVKYIKK